VFQTGVGQGASGSFFFFSHDKNFVVKTMTSDEKNFFVTKLAKKYFDHLEKHPLSCFARIYGVYSVKMQGI
jgi:1-phosphatidylinositol-4-phosphate 5-kinase